jgi:hypothetical protein
LKKHQATLLVLLAIAIAVTVGCGNSSPTYSNVPFMSNRTVDPATPLFTMKLDGSNVTPIPVGDVDLWFPSASANQQTLAFNLDDEVWASAGGATPVQITHVTDTADASVAAVRVSPNGKKILYAVSTGSSQANFSLWIMNADGSNNVNVTPPAGMDSCHTGSFSSDSSKIVFACFHI